MAKKPAWRRKMTPEQRLEYDIQRAWLTIYKLWGWRNAVDANWLRGNLKYWGTRLRTLMLRWEEMTKKPYRFTEPVWFNYPGTMREWAPLSRRGEVH